MGLIKAIGGAVGGVLADQWKEYFYCEAIPAEVLAIKGQKRTGARSSNTRGERAIAPYVAAAEEARRVGLGLNAGHDLNTENLQYFIERIPWVDEVSIGHALISDALYWGLENTVAIYQRCISRAQQK